MTTFIYIITSLLVLAMVTGLFVIIMILLKNKRDKLPMSDRFRYSVGAYVCILVSFANWVFNLGDIRGMIAIPMLIHGIIFFVTTWYASKYVAISEPLEKAVAMSILMFLVMHLLLPDFSLDVGETYYLFFGLIHSDQTATVCLMLAIIALFVNIVMLVRQLYLAFKMR